MSYLKKTGPLYFLFNLQVAKTKMKYKTISQTKERLTDKETKGILEKESITPIIYVRESQTGQERTKAKG